MRSEIVVREFPGAVVTAILTAITTLLLAMALSWLLGGENRAQASATRCYAAASVNMLHDAFEANPIYDSIRDNYPRINTDGLNCRSYLSNPPEGAR